MISIKPYEIVLPIIETNDLGHIVDFLGTGCFISSPPIFLTANHVIKGRESSIAVKHPESANLLRATVISQDASHDLALLSIDGYTPTGSFNLASAEANTNQSMITLEYGTTIKAGQTIHLSPATRLGNITRYMDLIDSYGPAGVRMLEMSFPALKGASGAPIISNDNKFELQGVIVANISYHLLPAQIETVLDNSNSLLEETRYLLPQAVAVNVIHVQKLIEEALGGA